MRTAYVLTDPLGAEVVTGATLGEIVTAASPLAGILRRKPWISFKLTPSLILAYHDSRYFGESLTEFIRAAVRTELHRRRAAWDDDQGVIHGHA